MFSFGIEIPFFCASTIIKLPFVSTGQGVKKFQKKAAEPFRVKNMKVLESILR